MSLLELKKVNSFYGSSHILFDIDLHVDSGECVAILGRNGAGKSTLLNTVMGAIKPKSGEILFADSPVHAAKPEYIASLGIQLVPEGRNIFSNLTVHENLKLASLTASDPLSIGDIYQMFPRLEERSHNRGRALSGGEQQMLAIGRALIRKPRVILLDEPFEGLAPSIVDGLLDVCRRLVYEHQTIVIVEQDVDAVLELSSRCYVMNNGYIVFDGTSDELRSDSRVITDYLGV